MALFWSQVWGRGRIRACVWQGITAERGRKNWDNVTTHLGTMPVPITSHPLPNPPINCGVGSNVCSRLVLSHTTKVERYKAPPTHAAPVLLLLPGEGNWGR